MNEEIEIIMGIINKCKPVEAFEIDGHIFIGSRVHLAKEYLKENTTIEFTTWLIDKNIETIKK